MSLKSYQVAFAHSALTPARPRFWQFQTGEYHDDITPSLFSNYRHYLKSHTKLLHDGTSFGYSQRAWLTKGTHLLISHAINLGRSRLCMLDQQSSGCMPTL